MTVEGAGLFKIVAMPPQTGLTFYRKKQTVETFQKERPKHLQQFYEAVEENIQTIENKLKILEFSFYGSNNGPQDFVKMYLPEVEKTMAFCKLSFFRWHRQMEDLFLNYERSIGDPTMEVEFDKDNVENVLLLIRKVVTVLQTGYSDIVSSIFHLVDQLKKYCLSFMGADGDPYLETAINYERQRREYVAAIKLNLDDIPLMAERFEAEGMMIQEMGSVPRKIAEKCECEHVPLLVMFPAACENIRNACIGIRRWIQADSGYPTFLQHDVAELEIKRDSKKKLLRDIQARSSQIEHKIKMCKRDIDDSAGELKRTTVKENSILIQEAEVLKLLHEVDTEIDFRKIRQEELKPKLDTFGVKEKIEELSDQILEYQRKRKSHERKHDEIKRKLELLNSRRTHIKEREIELGENKIHHKEIRKELRRVELEGERLTMNIDKLKEIHKFKTSPDVLKKLFFNLPIVTTTGALMKKKKGDTIIPGENGRLQYSFRDMSFWRIAWTL